jgi:hypothetical protein
MKRLERLEIEQQLLEMEDWRDTDMAPSIQYLTPELRTGKLQTISEAFQTYASHRECVAQKIKIKWLDSVMTLEL